MMRCGTQSNRTYYKEEEQYLDLYKVRKRDIINQLKTHQFTSLRLEGVNVDEFLETLMNLNIEKIIHLNLINTGIHDRVFCKIMSKNWESLKQLYLNDDNIGNQGLKMFRVNTIKNLQILSLNNCSIGYEGAKILSKTYFPSLKILALQQNNLGFNGHLAILNIKVDTIREIWTGETIKTYHYMCMNDPISAIGYVSIESQFAPAEIRVKNQMLAQHFGKIMKSRWKSYF